MIEVKNIIKESLISFVKIKVLKDSLLLAILQNKLKWGIRNEKSNRNGDGQVNAS